MMFQILNLRPYFLLFFETYYLLLIYLFKVFDCVFQVETLISIRHYEYI